MSNFPDINKLTVGGAIEADVANLLKERTDYLYEHQSQPLTAEQLLEQIKTVDGSNSGLDADLLDGKHSSEFAATAHSHGISDITGLSSALDSKINSSIVGRPSGVASLDSSGKVPSSQLPGFVDDVIEVANFQSLPLAGASGVIYVTIDTNQCYRWGGSSYVEISASPGTSDAVAEGSVNLYFTPGRARAAVTDISGNSHTADQLKTPRLISLSGGITGEALFDGSGNVVVLTTINSHRHAATDISGLSTVAVSGSYDDLSNKPSVVSIGAQPVDSDLTAISNLPNSGGLLRKTSDGVWNLDHTNYTKIGSGIPLANGIPSAGQSEMASAMDHVHPIVPSNLGITYNQSSIDITSSTGSGVTLDAASETKIGLFSIEDKIKLDSIAPGATGDMSAPDILNLLKTVDGSGTGLDADLLDGKHASEFTLNGHTHSVTDVSGLSQILSTKIDKSSLGVEGGVATLDENGKIPSPFLPSFVDDVLEYQSLSLFPITGNSGIIYVDISSGNTYRWSGSGYIEICASPGSSDEVSEGVINLYYTPERVQEVMATGISGSADRLSSPISITLAGGISGTAITDGSSDITINTIVHPESHVHPISAITGLSKVAESGVYGDLLSTPNLGTASSHDVPSSGNATDNQVVLGNDSRLSDARPSSDVSAWAKSSSKPEYTASEVGAQEYNQVLTDLTNISGVGYIHRNSDGSFVTSEVSTNVDLGSQISSDNITITSSTGTDVIINSASEVNAGLMSSSDKIKLVGIEEGATGDMTPAEILSAIKTVDGSGSGLDADLLDGKHASEFSLIGHIHTIGDIAGLQTELDSKINSSLLGSTGGIATLDASGKVPTIQLPSYVDDVLEYTNYDNLPVIGESSKIYITNDTNKTYRWSGSGYVEISASPGTTDSVIEGSVNLYFTADRARAAVADIPGNAATASKLETPRSISLTGDVSGSVSFDGSSSVTIMTTVADDSHRHTVTTIDGLGTVVTYDVPSSGDATDNQVVLGNDSRLSDARPASDVSAWAKSSVKPTYSYSEVGAQEANQVLTDLTNISGVGYIHRNNDGSFVTSEVSTVVDLSSQVSSDNITVISSAGTDVIINSASEVNAGLMSSSDKIKLVGIEEGATGDMTPVEILSAIKTVDGSGSGLDAEFLDGKHSSEFSLVGHNHGIGDIDGIGTVVTYDVPSSGDATDNQIVLGSDTRLSDARPAIDVSAWAKASSKPEYTASEVGAQGYNQVLTDFTNISGVGYIHRNNDGSFVTSEVSTNVDLGSQISSDNITITSSTGTDVIINSASEVNAGLMSSSDKIKLVGIEDGATGDMTPVEILTAIKTVDGSGSGLDAEFLDGKHSSEFSLVGHNHTIGEIDGLGTVATYDVSSGGDATNNQVVLGNDSRLSDARPASDVSAWAKSPVKPTYSYSEVGAQGYNQVLTDFTNISGVGYIHRNNDGSFVTSEVSTNVDLGSQISSENITITSSTGTDVIINSATFSAAGLMSSSDKIKLVGIEDGATGDMTPIEILSAIKAVDGSGSGLDADLLDGKHASEFSLIGHNHTISDITGLQNELDSRVNSSLLGASGGVATLDSSGKVPSIQLPSYVDDVLEYETFDSLPLSGTPGIIYITNDTNKTYRWSGSGYVEISASPGTTDSVVEGSVNLYFTTDRARAAVTDISGNAATASRLQTPRTISLTGDISGSVSFDGSSSVTIVSNVVGDSHRHTISTIDGLGTVATYNVPSLGNATINQVVLGNDTRLSDARPASDVSAWAKSPVKPTYSYSEVGAQEANQVLTDLTNISGVGYIHRNNDGSFVTSEVSTVVNLSSQVSPDNITVISSAGTDVIINSATSFTAGLMSSSDKIKLVGIEEGATGDMSPAEILSAIKSVDGSGSGLDAEFLDGKHASEFSLIGHNHTISEIDGLGTVVTYDVPLSGDATINQVVLGNDTRLSDARPASDVGNWAKVMIKPDAQYFGAQEYNQVLTDLTNISGVGFIHRNNDGSFVTSEVSTSVDLGSQISSDNITITSSTGTDVIINSATSSTAGLMSSSDKIKLAGIEEGATGDMTSSEILSAIKTVDGSGSGLDADLLDGKHASEFSLIGHIHTIGDITGLQTELDSKINSNLLGSTGGIATLDSSGKVPSTQLPSYVDDVVEYPNYANLPASGSSGIIYITVDTNKTYRWSGSGYVEISASPGTTDSLVEGSVNLYFTADRARAAVTDIPGNAATATKLQTPRTISLSGDVTGSVSFDGSSSVTIVSAVVDNSHRHDRTTIDGLGTVVTYDVPTTNNATATQVVLGNDTRLSNPRPASDVGDWAKVSTKPDALYFGAQPLDSDLSAIAALSGSGLLNRDTSGAWSLSTDALASAFNTVPRLYSGGSTDFVNCNTMPYGVAVVRISTSTPNYNSNFPVFDNCTYAYIQNIRPFVASSDDGNIQIAWPINTSGGGKTIIGFRSRSGTSISNFDWEYITPSDYALTTHTHSITDLGAQPLDSDLTAISKLTSLNMGIMCRTGTGVYDTRKIVSSQISAITITNEDGKDGDPTINLEGDLKAIDNLTATSGFLKKISANNWTLDDTSYSPVDHTHGVATTTSDGFMSSAHVTAITSVTSDIANLQSSKEPTITTLPVSKGGTGVNTLTGVAYFNGTSSITPATSTQIRSLIGTSTTLMTGLNADLLDGLHASAFSPVGHAHSAATATSDGFMSSAHVAALSTATENIANLQSSKEPTITTLPVSKGGTGVNTLTGVGYFNGTSSITPATSTQIRSLIGTSTTLMTGLNADLLDGLHASAFSPVDHSHNAATTISDGFMSTAHVSSLISAMTDITDLQTTKENKISLSGILKGNGTSGLSTATSADIVPLVPNATTSASGLMSNTDKLKLNSIYISTDTSLPNSYGIAAGYTVSGLTNHYGIDISLNSSTDTVNVMSGSNIQYGIRSRSYENTLNEYVTGASGKCQSIGIGGYGRVIGGGSTAGIGSITYGGYFTGSAESSSTSYPYSTAVYGIYASGRASNTISIVDTLYGVYADVSSADANKITNAYGVCISMNTALAINKFSIYSPDAVPMYHRGEVRIHTSSTSSVGTTISTAGVKMPNVPSSDQALFDYYQEYSVANGITATSGSTTSQSTVKFTRSGNTIIMDFPTITITTTATTFTMTYVTPTDMKPSSSKEFLVRGMDNGVAKICRMVLDTSGTFTLYNGINSEAFTNSGLKGILTSSIAYTLG